MSLYPNIYTVISLVLVTPVTSATVERRNSSLRLIKNAYRSTMTEERLNALLMLFVHKDIPLNYEEVVNEYARRHARRLSFVNPLSD